MYKAFKYRIYPTKLQKVLLEKHFGSCRFVYNLALETKINAYRSNRVNLSAFDLGKQLPELKKECEWLKEVNSQALCYELKNLECAYKKFFKGSGFPKFKSKTNHDTFTSYQHNKLTNKLIIPKFQEGIKIVLSRPIEGIIKSVTISKTPTGKYYASILCDINKELPVKPEIKPKTTIGVDLGIKDYAILSNGDKISNPKHYKKQLSRLKFQQSKYSKYKGKKTKQKVARIHEKIKNQRNSFLQETSTKLIRENQTIGIETLKVKNMIKNHKLAQAIQDAGWGNFVRMLEYKAEWYGVNLIKIDTFSPSSKTCSECGHVYKELELKEREWVCESCGVVHDRDVNAANNIKNFALYMVSVGDTKIHKELSSVEEAMTCEVI